MSSISNDIQVAFARERVLLRRQSSHLCNGFSFFLLMGLVYQILLGPELIMPTGVALAVLWVLSCLTIIFVAQSCAEADIDNGFFELWLSQQRSLWLLFLVKMLFQWCIIGVLLAFFTPILCLQLGLSVTAMPMTMLSLFISSLAMLCFSGFGATVTSGQASSGLLMAVLVMPLNIAPMIFGAGVVVEFLQGVDPVPILTLLLAMSLAAMLLLPPLMALCVRIILE